MEQGRELEGMKAVLMCPTYGPADPVCQKDLRIAMMSCSNHGLYWASDASTDRMNFSSSRNHAAEGVYRAGIDHTDGIMWVDSDIRQGPGDMLNLLTTVKVRGLDFVSGVYHQREGAHHPVFYHFDQKFQRFRPLRDYPENILFPADGCGFGFVWTSNRLIREIVEHPEFNPDDGWFPDKRDAGGFGEDLSFCFQAMRTKHQLFVHTGIQVGHRGDPNDIYRENFLKEKARREELGLDKVVPSRMRWGGEK